MEWFKKHVDTVIILTAFGASTLWMNGKFNELDHRLTVIETVMILQKMMPKELIAKEG